MDRWNHDAINPSLPKSSKYLVSRCLDLLQAFSGGVWGSKHLLTRYLEDQAKAIPPGNSKAMEIDFVRVYELKVTVAFSISWGEMDSDSFSEGAEVILSECWNFTGKVLEEWQIVMFDQRI